MKKQAILNHKPQWRGSFEEYITAIDWSQDGKSLAIANAAGEISLYQAGSKSGKSSGGKLNTLKTADEASIDCLQFSADGQWLAAAGQGGQLQIWDAQKLSQGEFEPAVTLDLGGKWIDRLVWHPTIAEFAYSLGKYVQVWSAIEQDIVATLDFDQSTVLALDWHPSGDWLTVGGYKGLKMWQRQDWFNDPVTLELATATNLISWDRGGKYLATDTMDMLVILIGWLGDDFDADPWRLSGFPGKIRDFVWSYPQADSSDAKPFLVSCSGADIVVWHKIDGATREEETWSGTLLQGHSGQVNLLTMPAGQNLLTSAGAEGEIMLWDRAKTWLQTLNTSKSEITCVAWQSGGKKLAAGNENGEVFIWAEQTKSAGFGA
ncbi:WD40 repeat domain-containing protein [Thalassoporum mexicanum]|uniref:WD40 repeat domain-containing protein n=1 Tax=Thalassoporum mexicanum TaxID=3457544 RepID=UPI0002E9E34F|nr:WD40 repeat domain-containing protein [Pseudanabaena sp. PCC 7367]